MYFLVRIVFILSAGVMHVASFITDRINLHSIAIPYMKMLSYCFKNLLNYFRVIIISNSSLYLLLYRNIHIYTEKTRLQTDCLNHQKYNDVIALKKHLK